jgi:phosphatidylethanolamine/phosphatidyl-N-methylethanolamine N-methyltransferase
MPQTTPFLSAHCSFLRQFLRNPRAVGAIAPATRLLAEKVGEATRQALGRHREESAGAELQVLELGAGTGALTRGISALRPVLIERDAHWAAMLRLRFPELEVRQECATHSLSQLRAPTGVVTSIPLLNNPQADAIRELLAARYAEGMLRFCVLYTYGWRDPLKDAGFSEARRFGIVPRSLPPACVWVYR